MVSRGVGPERFYKPEGYIFPGGVKQMAGIDGKDLFNAGHPLQ